MEELERWPVCRALRCYARHRPAVQFWLFGSVLRVPMPTDLDILAIYTDRQDLVPVKAIVRFFNHRLPPVHLTAMTGDEEREYRFIETVGAQRLFVA